MSGHSTFLPFYFFYFPLDIRLGNYNKPGTEALEVSATDGSPT